MTSLSEENIGITNVRFLNQPSATREVLAIAKSAQVQKLLAAMYMWPWKVTILSAGLL